jgi:hypothetical protein
MCQAASISPFLFCCGSGRSFAVPCQLARNCLNVIAPLAAPSHALVSSGASLGDLCYGLVPSHGRVLLQHLADALLQVLRRPAISRVDFVFYLRDGLLDAPPFFDADVQIGQQVFVRDDLCDADLPKFALTNSIN